MAVPNLIHPVPIEIKQISKAETHYDHDAREPIQFAARKNTVTVPGQPRWRSSMDESHERGGAIEGADGYVLFRYVDLIAKGVTLQREDCFVKIGGEETDVYISRLQPTGHYTEQGGATMVKAHFVDRKPARGT